MLYGSITIMLVDMCCVYKCTLFGVLVMHVHVCMVKPETHSQDCTEYQIPISCLDLSTYVYVHIFVYSR